MSTAALLIGTSLFAPADRGAAHDTGPAVHVAERPALVADSAPESARDRRQSLRTSLLLLLPRG